MVLERALIHHLSDLAACFHEAHRILKPNGTLIIQDRTPSDCLLEGTSEHIRGYIFSRFPHLAKIEVSRRHTSDQVKQALKTAGFSKVEKVKLWETRNTYMNKEDLLNDLRARVGRSILHELNEKELEDLVKFIDGRVENNKIIEKDRWTVWKAVKAE